MRKVLGAVIPRLWKHDVQRYGERLADMNVPNHRRVGDDCVGHERRQGRVAEGLVVRAQRIGSGHCAPRTLDNLFEHLILFHEHARVMDPAPYLTGNVPTREHSPLTKLLRISGQRVKFQFPARDGPPVDLVARDPNPVACGLQLLPKRAERQNIAVRPDDEDANVQLGEDKIQLLILAPFLVYRHEARDVLAYWQRHGPLAEVVV
mmetsp:Transcript_36918/g.83104  ORF Transcript_36918/g.83104 Transcript_36918/m.83104 type:complete len:206 (-) Transcript_36918:494-1111(-)